ncbi:MAG: hypothetical protein JO115_20700 [Pseudonocardiales bacterium]|nr:hypothetical protein [Pseudonocardiales bacterium]
MSATPPAAFRERDSYAITADRLRLAWPEVLDPRHAQAGRRSGDGINELTILHVSDPQFGRHHLFGGNGLTPADQAYDTLFQRLHDDLIQRVRAGGGLPDRADRGGAAVPPAGDHRTRQSRRQPKGLRRLLPGARGGRARAVDPVRDARSRGGGGRVELDGEVTDENLQPFVRRVHHQFASADPSVRSELVYSGHPVTDKSVTEARRHALLLPDGSFKLEGDPGRSLWWAIKQCRFEPGELDPDDPTIRRLPPDAPIPR